MNIRDNPEGDALYVEYLRLKIERAEAAVAEGKVFSHEEVVERSRQWFEGVHPRGPRPAVDP